MSQFPDESHAQDDSLWRIGRPQGAIAALIDSGKLESRLLEIGCGTGDNCLYAAATGLEAVGVDASLAAIRTARSRAGARRRGVRFYVHSPLRLRTLGERFKTVIDSGIFHALSDADRPEYLKNLEAVLEPKGTLYVLCLSDAEPEWGGPRRISRRELEDNFHGAFRIERIESTLFETQRSTDGSKAWLASIRRAMPSFTVRA